MTPKRIDRVARREKVLDAAVRVFARKGFAASRIEDVAAEAGIGKGSVYLEFGSREELLTAAFEAYAEKSAAILRQAVLGGAPALDRLTALIAAVVDLLAAEPDRARILLDVWAAAGRTGPATAGSATDGSSAAGSPVDGSPADGSPADGSATTSSTDGSAVGMAAVYRDYRAAVTALLREGVAEGTVRADADERHATVLVGAVEGCLLQWLVDPRVPVGRLAGPIAELCVEGLRNREAA